MHENEVWFMSIEHIYHGQWQCTLPPKYLHHNAEKQNPKEQ